MSLSRPLSLPRPVEVEAGADGRPAVVDGATVETLREEWVVEDRWWSGHPLARRYFELVLADGRDQVVYRDLERGRWLSQRA